MGFQRLEVKSARPSHFPPQSSHFPPLPT
jgi:hypothetical protein